MRSVSSVWRSFGKCREMKHWPGEPVLGPNKGSVLILMRMVTTELDGPARERESKINWVMSNQQFKLQTKFLFAGIWGLARFSTQYKLKQSGNANSAGSQCLTIAVARTDRTAQKHRCRLRVIENGLFSFEERVHERVRRE